MSEEQKDKIIHIAKIQVLGGGCHLLFLKQKAPNHYVWVEEEEAQEKETAVEAQSIEEALRLGSKNWNRNSFRTINCGFRYTLPERDEHGMNALFSQMAASYNSPNGVYFDSEVGHNCFVQNASNEALNILQRLKAKS